MPDFRLVVIETRRNSHCQIKNDMTKLDFISFLSIPFLRILLVKVYTSIKL
jgi:hypothetical protein